MYLRICETILLSLIYEYLGTYSLGSPKRNDTMFPKDKSNLVLKIIMASSLNYAEIDWVHIRHLS
jgi:hypothetical protein